MFYLAFTLALIPIHPARLPMLTTPPSRCGLALLLLLRFLPTVCAQELAIIAVDTTENDVRVQCVLKGVPAHVETRLVAEQRWSGAEQALPIRLEGRQRVWLRGGQLKTFRIPKLPAVLGSDGQNMEIRFDLEKSRVHIASRWMTLGCGALAAGSRIHSRRAYDDYLSATDQSDIDRHFQSAQSAQRTSLVAGGLTLGLGVTWKALADRLRWSPPSPSTEISLRPTTGDWYDWAAESNTPCRFSTTGSLPDTLHTAQIVVLQEGALCSSDNVARSEWQSVFTESFDIVARDQALENAILKEQRLWLEGIIADEWQKKVGELAGGQYTLLGHCASRPQNAEFRIIDNVSGREIWQALGRQCSADRFAKEVRLQIQETP